MDSLNLSSDLRQEPLSILAEEFPVMLSAFNGLVREMRGVGVEIKQQVLPDNKVFIDAASADLFLEQFGGCLRGVRFSSAGRFTCNSVTVRGVDVVWLTLVRGQEQ
ncbi:hypothetical protein [Pseudomonas anatoliensis]|uniref:hypothetical protein n=1 Tax=Pseudomonas anatoliensis TaxID=2710589 RepID=UPI001E37E035|nr:hypothetical protein [Pseudomonas anatoliensis]